MQDPKGSCLSPYVKIRNGVLLVRLEIQAPTWLQQEYEVLRLKVRELATKPRKRIHHRMEKAPISDLQNLEMKRTFFQKMGCWNHLASPKIHLPSSSLPCEKRGLQPAFPRWKTTIRWVVHWGQRGILRWVRCLLAWQNLSIAAGRWEAFHVYLAPTLQRRKSISWRNEERRFFPGDRRLSKETREKKDVGIEDWKFLGDGKEYAGIVF